VQATNEVAGFSCHRADSIQSRAPPRNGTMSQVVFRVGERKVLTV